MSKSSSIELPPLESALLRAMQAIDSQIAREMQRTPKEQEIHGAQKWGPISSRVERIVTFILDQLGGDAVKLDSLLVFSQAFTKALRFTCEDLGDEGLGKVRSGYCLGAMEEIGQDVQKARTALNDQPLM